MTITILRLGHRPERDKRLSTHLLLAARAFGAKNAFYTGIKDTQLENSINKVRQEWGGKFTVNFIEKWRDLVLSWDGKIVHLTMYGLPIQDVIKKIRDTDLSILVVVGSTKVPKELYTIANWNVSITNQPHSEVSALAIFLHELYKGQDIKKKFTNARLIITPSPRGKEVKEFSKD
jgi:tRNA (cytidine56-2'-O)-methyltransferase